MKQNVPFLPQRYFDFVGLPDAGGWIWIYLKGTNTPATSAIWYDADGLVPGANPVPLDSAGQPEDTGAFYLDSGAYTLKLFGADGVQIGPPVDAIIYGSAFGGGSEIVAQGSAIICKTYADVRGLIEDWDTVYVCGRTGDGDGGQGWFQRFPTSTESDDDGICLVSGSNRYIREFDAFIDPRWYGLVYGGTVDQWTKTAIVGAASLHWSRPAQFGGSTFLGQNGTILSSWSIRCDAAGGFVSATGAPVVLTFQDGSEFDGVGVCFGPEVNPLFAPGAVPVVPLSWMGGVTGDQRLQKWSTCSSGEQDILLDDLVTTATLPAFPSGMHLDVAPGAGKITLTAAANLSVDVVYQGLTQWLDWGSLGNIGAVNVGRRSCRPEWFGAVGNNTTDDGIPLRAAAKTGDIVAGYNKSYRTTVQIATAPLTVRGDTTAPLTLPTLAAVADPPNPRIYMDPPAALDVISLASAGRVAFLGTNLSMTANAGLETNTGTFAMIGGAVFASAGKVKSTALQIQDSVVSSMAIFTASAEDSIYLDNVRDDTDAASRVRRRYKNRSQFKKVYLEEELNPSAFDRVLTTDAAGLVGGKNSLALDSLMFNALALATKFVMGKKVVTGNYTLLAADPPIIVVDTSAAAATLTVPYAAGEEGKTVLVVNKTGASSFYLFVQAPGGESMHANTLSPFSIPQGVVVQRAAAWITFVDGKWAMA